ncbi:Hypothetical protein SCLAV_p0027 (plasmid) [Streptomyces clavuligerus]|uniref:Uncharacterized protein n=1 Tax=Streptomyces clavuligerus TaxID=1901 RepID=D5SHX9_STRCL|nr:Hypothetical protein SCLAV_p0027 [Streptomyces clavuligerus]
MQDETAELLGGFVVGFEPHPLLLEALCPWSQGVCGIYRGAVGWVGRAQCGHG